MQIGVLIITLILMSPMEVLKKNNSLLEEAARNSQDNVAEKIIEGMIDFEKMAIDSLGRNIKLFTSSQRKKYVNLFKELLKKSSIKKLSAYKADRVDFVKEKLYDSKAEVFTKVWKGREITEVIYTMRKMGKEWKIIDIIIDGVSLVRNYRSQFGKVISKEGVEGLLHKMEKKIKEE